MPNKYAMKVLVLYDLDGKELYFNPEHVAFVHWPAMFTTAGARAVVQMSSGYECPVLDTPGDVCYKLLLL